MRVVHNDFYFNIRGTAFCCGLYELGDFSFRTSEVSESAEVLVDDAEVTRIQNFLNNYPSVLAVTIDYPEEYPVQRCAGEVLKAVGFKQVNHFTGNSGNPLVMWVYNR